VIVAVPSARQVGAVVLTVGTAGTGFIVTVNIKLDPGQEPEVGVIVYVAVCGIPDEFVRVPEMLPPEPAAPPVIPPVTTGIPHE
jgi:hypothetical protein